MSKPKSRSRSVVRVLLTLFVLPIAVCSGCLGLLGFNRLGSARDAPRTPTPEPSKPSVLRVDITKVRAEPFKSENGIYGTMIYVDWMNTGSLPIRKVEADFYGDEKKVSPFSGFLIYADSTDGPGIQPGESYQEPYGQGFFIPAPITKGIRTYTVKVTKVSEEGY